MRGFTLVEVLVAMAILAVAGAGIAGLATIARRTAADARRDDIMARAAASKMAVLRSLSFAVDATTGAAITDTSTNVTTDTPTGGGVGLTTSPASALTANTAGYVDYVTAAGIYAGTGSAPPRTAAFVRRWSIAASAASASTLVLQVVVLRVGALQPDVRLLSMLARVAR